MSRNICVIPARMGSSRYPGKPLEKLLGLPLVLHVYARCRLYDGFERVCIATCDEEIADAAEAYGAEAVMTADTHERCTDRVSEAVGHLNLGLSDTDLVLMVQGDEILMAPDMARDVAESFRQSGAPVVNIASPITRAEDHDDPNVVKVVARPDGGALYFSRAPIPSRTFQADVPQAIPMYQQTGVIGFSAPFLDRFAELFPTPLEQRESVDMLRVLEHGLDVQMVFTDHETIGVDTPADRDRAEIILRTDPVTKMYL